MGVKHGKLRASLVVVEMSLALVLLISAGLLIKGSLRMQAVDLGFDPRNALTFAVSLSGREYPDTTQAIALQEELLQRLKAVPGVTAAAAVTQLPMSGGNGTYYSVEGEPVADEGRRPVLQYRNVSTGYFDVMGMTLVKGRDFTPSDRRGTTRYIVINETLAKRHWAAGDPLGKRLVLSSGTYEIMGIVRDVREYGPDDPTPAIAYFAAAQVYSPSLRYVMRSRRDRAAARGDRGLRGDGILGVPADSGAGDPAGARGGAARHHRIGAAAMRDPRGDRRRDRAGPLRRRDVGPVGVSLRGERIRSVRVQRGHPRAGRRVGAGEPPPGAPGDPSRSAGGAPQRLTGPEPASQLLLSSRDMLPF
jgi:hypothetical protein